MNITNNINTFDKPECDIGQIKNAMRRLLTNKVCRAVVVLFHLSKLRAEHKEPEHINIAINILRNTVGTQIDVDILATDVCDLVLIAHNVRHFDKMHECIFQLRYLFADDGIAYIGSKPNQDFCSIYYLPEHRDILYEWCLQGLGLYIDDCLKQDCDELKSKYLTLSSTISSAIEEIVDKLDMYQYISLENVYLTHNGAIALKEVKMDVVSIYRKIGNITDIVNYKGMRMFVKRCLDLQLITYMLYEMQKKENSSQYFLIELSIDTFLSNEFALLEQCLPELVRKHMIISFHLSDMLDVEVNIDEITSNIKKNGYYLCISGITFLQNFMVNFAFFKADVIKLDMAHLYRPKQELLLECVNDSIINSIGLDNIIACKCSDSDIKTLRSLGVAMYSYT